MTTPRQTIYDFLMLRSSQRKFLAERYGVFTPGEAEDERNKRIVRAVAEQGKQAEFAELVAAAKTER